MRPIRLLILLAFPFAAAAGDGKYPVRDIPLSLLKNANVVKRMEETAVEIASPTDVYVHYKYALTILNEAGARMASFAERYDKFQHITDLEGSLYDADGNFLKRVKNKDIGDVSLSEGMLDDDRMKSYTFYCKSYPYTVEFEASLRVNQSFYLPYWLPQQSNVVSVQSSKFAVTVPSDYTLRFKAFNYQGKPTEGLGKNKKTWLWEVKNIPAITWPQAAPSWSEVTTSVSLAPSEFQMDDYKGKMTTWSELGMFIYQLNKDRDQLPEPQVEKVKQLTSGISDAREKIKVLYKYLQQNTRYISIQLGIGGFQTMKAEKVAKTGYGDCKALSNYMTSLLKAAGIPSYYALVKAGDYNHSLREDFPSNQFNHMIVCVPLAKDSVWLECTSQQLPAGYMSEFTGNRKALLITERGGFLVPTPKYSRFENVMKRKIDALIDGEGNIEMKIAATYSGTQQDDLSSMIKALSREKVQRHLQEELDLASYQVKDFSYKETVANIPALEENLVIAADHYATVTGKRLFVLPNLMNRLVRKFEEDSARTADLVFPYEYIDEDEYSITIPEGFEVESMPKPTEIKSQFGWYQASTTLEGNKIYYKRRIEKFSGRYPATELKAIISFYEGISKSDRARVVLVKKTS